MEAKLMVVLAGSEKAQSHENADGIELGPPAMADMAVFSRCRARARRGSGRESVGQCGEGARGFPHHQRAWTRGGARGKMRRRELCMAAHASSN